MRVPLKHRPHEPQHVHRAPSWPRDTTADAPISFADIAAMPDPQAGLFDAALLEPLELTDWSAQLADAFELIDASVAFKAQAFRTHLEQIGTDYVMAVKVLTGAQIADAGILAAEAKAFAVELKAEVAL